MKRVFILLFILLATTAHAEIWVCYDDQSDPMTITKRVIGDCLNLGLCSGANNTGLQSNCFEANETEYSNASNKYYKYDRTVVSGDKIVEMTQAEKDALDAAEAQAAEDALSSRLDKLEANLEDVIVALVKRINVRIPGNPITKQEVIDQLKSDQGL